MKHCVSLVWFRLMREFVIKLCFLSLFCLFFVFSFAFDSFRLLKMIMKTVKITCYNAHLCHEQRLQIFNKPKNALFFGRSPCACTFTTRSKNINASFTSKFLFCSFVLFFRVCRFGNECEIMIERA